MSNDLPLVRRVEIAKIADAIAAKIRRKAMADDRCLDRRRTREIINLSIASRHMTRMGE